MDYAKSGWDQLYYPFRDSTQTVLIQWRVARDDAPTLPFPSRFRNPALDNSEDPDPNPPWVPIPKYKWKQNWLKPFPVKLDKHICGDAEDFRIGEVFDSSRNIKYGPLGLPVCCLAELDVGGGAEGGGSVSMVYTPPIPFTPGATCDLAVEVDFCHVYSGFTHGTPMVGWIKYRVPAGPFPIMYLTVQNASGQFNGFSGTTCADKAFLASYGPTGSYYFPIYPGSTWIWFSIVNYYGDPWTFNLCPLPSPLDVYGGAEGGGSVIIGYVPPTWTLDVSGGGMGGGNVTLSTTWTLDVSGGGMGGGSVDVVPTWFLEVDGGGMGGGSVDVDYTPLDTLDVSGGAEGGGDVGITFTPQYTLDVSGGAEGGGDVGITFTPQYTLDVSGGAEGGGDVGITFTPQYTLDVSGGAEGGGSVSLAYTSSLDVSGGAEGGGSVSLAYTSSLDVSGGAEGGGSVSLAYTSSLDVSGGAEGGGSVVPVFTPAIVPAGGAEGGGSVVPVFTPAIVPAGGAEGGGSVVPVFTPAIVPAGGAEGGGSVVPVFTPAIVPAGGAEGGGSVTLSYAVPLPHGGASCALAVALTSGVSVEREHVASVDEWWKETDAGADTTVTFNLVDSGGTLAWTVYSGTCASLTTLGSGTGATSTVFSNVKPDRTVYVKLVSASADVYTITVTWSP